MLCGIDVEGDGVGYKQVRIRPQIGGDFTHASATYETPYGKVASGWKIGGGKLTLKAEIPVNSTAVIYIPATAINGITEGGKALSASKDVEVQGVENGYVKVKAGSGSYEFTTPYTPTK